MRSRFGAVVGGLVVGVVGVVGCVAEGPDGTTGAEGKVVFQADSNLVFSSPMAVGSTFRVTFEPKTDETELSKDAALVVVDGDATVVAVADDKGAFDVTLDKRGTVKLGVDDGGTVDTINVDARNIGDSALVDSVILGATDVVDGTLPAHFAILAGEKTKILVSAVDACATGLLDLGASKVVVVTEEGVDPATVATVEKDGIAGLVIDPVQSGTFTLELQSGDLAPLQYEVDVVDRGDVDEVHAEVASVDTQAGTARLWGRGFVNDVDVIGLTFDWSSDARVALDSVSASAVTASISFPTDGTVDDRPATVTAEVFGTDDTVDLLALQEGSLVVARASGPVRPEDAADDSADDTSTEDAGCGGGTAGNTCSAAAVAAFVFVKRRRRA